MDTTNFIARWVRMTIHRGTVAFRRHLPPNQSLLSPLLNMRDERHVEGLRLPKDEGCTHLTVNHSLNFVDPDTSAHTQRKENTWWGVKRSIPRTGTSKDLFESYLKEWLWCQLYGDDPFAKTLSSISPIYEVRKDA